MKRIIVEVESLGIFERRGLRIYTLVRQTKTKLRTCALCSCKNKNHCASLKNGSEDNKPFYVKGKIKRGKVFRKKARKKEI